MPRGWKKEQLARARKARMCNRATHIPTVYTKKDDFITAMQGTWGIKSSIAKRLGVTRQTVCRLLDRPDWTDVKDEWKSEVEAGIDEAEATIQEAIENRNPFKDYSVATTNARWLLTRLRRERFGDQSKTIIEGGANPIKIMAGVVNVDQLSLPVEVRRQLVNAMDQKEEEERQRILEQGETIDPARDDMQMAMIEGED